MGIIFAVFQTVGKIPSDTLLLIRNVILGDIISQESFNIHGPMSSRPVDFDISKLRIYFLTNAIFISGILKETLLSTFESTNFFIYSKLESCIGSF